MMTSRKQRFEVSVCLGRDIKRGSEGFQVSKSEDQEFLEQKA